MGLRVIAVDSLAGWIAQELTHPTDANRSRVTAVLFGRAALRLPDGRCYWVPVRGYAYAARIGRSRGEALVKAVLEHGAIVGHEEAQVFVPVGSNDPSAAYCAQCRRYVDLTLEDSAERP